MRDTRASFHTRPTSARAATESRLAAPPCKPQMMEVPIKRPREAVRWDEVALAVLTTTFLLIPHPWIGYLVALNGVLCHGSAALGCRCQDAALRLDVACNVGIGVYANAQACAQPVCGAITTASLAMWLAQPIACRAAYHAVFVQMPLFAAFAHFAISCSGEPR